MDKKQVIKTNGTPFNQNNYAIKMCGQEIKEGTNIITLTLDDIKALEELIPTSKMENIN